MIIPSCIFPYNPTLIGMRILNEVVEIDFKKKDKETKKPIKETRVYVGMDKTLAYQLLYSKTPLKFFVKEIKKKFKVVEVKTLK